MGSVLSREQLKILIDGDPSLIEAAVNLDQQLQPNGIDLTLREVSRFAGPATLSADNAGRVLPALEAVPFDDDGFLSLDPGVYTIVLNEIARLPTDVMAFGRPRSSLNRSGVTIHTAVWDAGYQGRSTSLLSVLNPAGFRVARDARVLQLVFVRLEHAAESGYQGRYQGENL